MSVSFENLPRFSGSVLAVARLAMALLRTVDLARYAVLAGCWSGRVAARTALFASWPSWKSPWTGTQTSLILLLLALKRHAAAYTLTRLSWPDCCLGWAIAWRAD